jgi:signal transduction histidine kinase
MACLGVPAVFLLTGERGTQNCSLGATLPADYHPAYQAIQDWTFGSLNSSGPFVFSQQEHQNVPDDAQSQAMFERLDGSCFLPIHDGRDMRLSIGLLRADASATVLAEEPTELAGILNSYLRTPIHELLNFLGRMETAIERTKRKTLLEHTSRFCLYVGQTQLDVLNEAATNNEIEPSKEYFQKLKKLALDLQATGNEFSQLSGGAVSAAVGAPRPVSVSSVVKRAMEEIEGQFLLERLELVERNSAEGFDLAIEQNDLFVTVLRVLQWMAQREDKTPIEVEKPTIEIAYVRNEERDEIHFTDQSRRLGVHLRQKMFEPFTQATPPITSTKEDEEELPGLYLPLYLAKMLVEVKNNGSLEDRSDQLEGAHGHRFVISFPAGEENSSADGPT